MSTEKSASVRPSVRPPGEAADEVAVVIADPYSFPADGFVEQANDALGLPLVGGLATGTRGAGSTRLLIDGRVVEEQVEA